MSQLAQAKYPRVLKVSLPKTNNLPLVNSHCHYNAVQAVKTGLAVGVIEVVMVYSDTCTAHYINLMEDGSMVDFTLGQMCINDQYRFVRHVPPSEYETINQSLMEFLNNSELLAKYLKVFKTAKRANIVKKLAAQIEEGYAKNTLGVRGVNSLIHQHFLQV